MRNVDRLISALIESSEEVGCYRGIADPESMDLLRQVQASNRSELEIAILSIRAERDSIKSLLEQWKAAFKAIRQEYPAIGRRHKAR